MPWAGLCAGPVDLGQVGLFEIGLDRLARQILVRPGDSPHLDPFEHPHRDVTR